MRVRVESQIKVGATRWEGSDKGPQRLQVVRQLSIRPPFARDLAARVQGLKEAIGTEV